MISSSRASERFSCHLREVYEKCIDYIGKFEAILMSTYNIHVCFQGDIWKIISISSSRFKCPPYLFFWVSECFGCPDFFRCLRFFTVTLCFTFFRCVSSVKYREPKIVSQVALIGISNSYAMAFTKRGRIHVFMCPVCSSFSSQETGMATRAV